MPTQLKHIPYKMSRVTALHLSSTMLSSYRTPAVPQLTLIKFVVYIATGFDQDTESEHKRKTRVTETSCFRNETNVIRASRTA